MNPEPPDANTAAANVKSVTLEAVVIRADGTREDLGVIASYHRNPLRRLVSRLQGHGKVRTH